jgi:NADPH:quinone reductase-like Zn-dependent oxidoreductase
VYVNVYVHVYVHVYAYVYAYVYIQTHSHTQVLIRVFAAALNPADYKHRRGEMRALVPFSFPKVKQCVV